MSAAEHAHDDVSGHAHLHEDADSEFTVEELLIMEADEEHVHESDPEEEPRVGPLELFFDLVFVFAITQVTSLLSQELTWANMVRGLAILSVVWWSWAGFSWLTNLVKADDGWARLAMFASMGAMLIVSLAVPKAFSTGGLTFGIAYLALSLLYIVTYAVLTRGDPALFSSVLRLAVGVTLAPIFLVIAGFLDAGPGRASLWAAAVIILFVGAFFSGTNWRVHPAHFAERHGLIVIIALGESIVAIGIGASAFALDAPAIVGSLLGLVLAACLWWLYFDVVALVAERRLTNAEGTDQVRMARDSYSVLHLPMVAGIVFFALGVKKVLVKPGEPLQVVAATALLGGIALYLVAHVLFRYRNTRSWSIPRSTTAGLMVLAIVLLQNVAAEIVLVAATVLLVALTAYETIKYREARHAVREHGVGGTWVKERGGQSAALDAGSADSS